MNITKNRQTWFTISIGLVAASILAILFLGFRLGLDFIGGARWDLTFDEPTTKTEVSTFFDQQSVLTKDVQIQTTGDENRYLITIQDLDDKSIQAIKADMTSQVGAYEEAAYRKVDATIGQSFKKKAFYAIIAALIGIILFVAFAFRKIPESINPWRFGGVAILALFHDIIIVTGIFVLLGFFFQVELDLPFITALLATLGFSVNDTIVILDRVRENIRLQKASETFEDTIEKSVQQTLMRSLNTSVSTLLPLIALLLFGAESIFFFVLALTIGILIGTYSSIFLAAPMLVTWREMAGEKA